MSNRARERFTAYRNSLRVLSARTGAPLPSLILSFGIIHEITAVVPLVSVFYGSRTLGIGEHIINAIVPEDLPTTDVENTWVKTVVRRWVEEGDAWAGRVGRRYGVFGYEKRIPGTLREAESLPKVTNHIAGDVANAVVAYGVTKALIPVRIGISLYLAPAFSRRITEPIRRVFIQLLRRQR